MNPIRQFELVIEIARNGSISGAAASLGLAQPTLSKYLANLESQLGIELFDRTTLPIRLTPAGERYIASGRRIVDTYHQLDKELSELKSKQESEVIVGMSPTRAAYMLPQIISEFRRLNLEARITVRERTTKQLYDELLRGDLDLIVSLLNDSTATLEREELFTESILLAVPSSCKALTAEEVLSGTPMISPGSNLYLGRVMAEILREFDSPKQIAEVQSIETSLGLVRKGIGSAIVPTYVADYGKIENVTFMELPGHLREKVSSALDRHVCIFYRKEQFLTQAERDFVTACRMSMSDRS